MEILDLQGALELDRVSRGSVLIQTTPQIRQGKKNPFMTGDFMTADGTAPFKIWEERIYDSVREHGTGIYDVEVCGSDFNGSYLTVRKIAPTADSELKTSDFLPAIPRDRLAALWQKAFAQLQEQGVSAKALDLIKKLMDAPELKGRFPIEGAAIYHHDNKIGGLMHHTGKMLKLLATVLDNTPELGASADLLTVGIALHDVGKVFEYYNLGLGTYWYANHRIRGIEFLAAHKEEITAAYDERFYRHLQAILAGHHGDFGDRPTTVATAIVHYIDTLDAQVTGFVEAEEATPGDRLRFQDWGWLEPTPLGRAAKE